MKNQFLATAAIACGLVAFSAADSDAVIIYQTGSNTANIPGLTGFSTDGAGMDGLAVTAVFTSGSQTVLWADTGATSGSAVGAGWSLSLTGDSFFNNWYFDFSPGSHLELVSLTLDGLDALTLFDRTFGFVEGTPGSGGGADWTCQTGNCNDVTVRYDYRVALGANPAVGDLWQTVFIDWSTAPSGGARGQFSFLQDTDNDSRLTTDNAIPEPGTLLLLGSGLVGTRLARRRRNG